MADTSPLLRASHLSHAFDYPLFEDLSFDLFAKESMSIVGRSGSGKSTLLHICSTLLAPQSGSVYLFGEEIYRLPKKRLYAVRRYDVGIIFQSHYLFKGFSAYENIEVASLLAREPIEAELLERFRITHVLHKRVSDLSGGEQQRVSIARVLTKRPRIIFADEPTGNLDSKTAQEVMETIFDYVAKRDAALFLVTHDEALAARCDRRYRLQEGSLVALGTT